MFATLQHTKLPVSIAALVWYLARQSPRKTTEKKRYTTTSKDEEKGARCAGQLLTHPRHAVGTAVKGWPSGERLSPPAPGDVSLGLVIDAWPLLSSYMEWVGDAVPVTDVEPATDAAGCG